MDLRDEIRGLVRVNEESSPCDSYKQICASPGVSAGIRNGGPSVRDGKVFDEARAFE